MRKFLSFKGRVTSINDFPVSSNDEDAGCYKLMSVVNEEMETVNFVVSPNTYFVNYAMIGVGDIVTGFYDANAPVPMIYPPQYRAVVIAKYIPYVNVAVDYFDSQLVSSDNSLKLNIAPCTQILLQNNQPFTNDPGNRNLIVVYGPTTRSIPAQTVPYKIIVMCSI